jgi:hypothetical protein
MQSLRDRREQLREVTPLASEAIPLLPHLLDIPKHLAVLSSAVVRHSRTTPQAAITRPAPLTHDTLMEDFAMKCFEIEEKAVQSVSRLDLPPSATAAPRHLRRVHSRLSNSPSRDGHTVEPTSRLSVTTLTDHQVPNSPNIPSRRRKSNRRPSTAPAASSTTDESTPHTLLPTLPLISPHDRLFNVGGNSLPASPNRQFAGKRTQQVPSDIYVKHSPVSALDSPPPNLRPGWPTLHRTLSQQLDVDEIEIIEESVAKRKGGFLRSLLSRTTK